MKVSELYGLYTEIKNKKLSDKEFQKETTALFDKNINISDASIDLIITAIREVRNSCIVENEGISLMDYTLLKIAMTVCEVSSLTDVEFSSDSDVYEEEYRMIFDMNIRDYIQRKEKNIFDKFVGVEETEEKNYQQSHSMYALVERYLSRLAESTAGVTEQILNAVDRFDPKQLEDAQNLLENMNKGVKDVSEILKSKD